MSLVVLATVVMIFTRPAWEPVALDRAGDGWIAAFAERLPDDGFIQLEAGLRARCAGRSAEAARALGTAAALLPDSARALAGDGFALLDRGQIAEARSALERAMRVARASVEVETLRAGLLRRTQGPMASLAVLRPLLQRHPDPA